MTYTPEQVNQILNFKGTNQKLIDIFDLHGVLFIGTPENGTWDLTETYTKFSEHSLTFIPEDFEDCKSEAEVFARFSERLRETVMEQLV